MIFMKRLVVKYVGHKIILISDNLKVHHCKPVKKELGASRDRIEVFSLQAYSPELNPDEYLNNDLIKRRVWTRMVELHAPRRRFERKRFHS